MDKNTISHHIGQTPLVALDRIIERFGLSASILAKVEGQNPAGSVKDRIALAMVDRAEQDGLLAPGGLIVEASSGNTGIGLALVAASRGYRLALTMPDTMSLERRQLLEAYGAQLHLTPGERGMVGAMEKAQQIVEENPGSFYARQFENPANPQVHYLSTGPEIWQQSQGQVDILVAGVGTGGTITGAGKYLKEQKPGLEVFAVEPTGSPVLSGGHKGKHRIQGIGAGFVPAVLDTGIYKGILQVGDEDAAEAARLLTREEGLLAGISAGAALFAAMALARKPEHAGKTIVVVLPDSGSRYLSSGLFNQKEEG